MSQNKNARHNLQDNVKTYLSTGEHGHMYDKMVYWYNKDKVDEEIARQREV